MTSAELAAQLQWTGGAVTGMDNVNVGEWRGSFDAHIIDVEVDPEADEVTILCYAAVQDADQAVPPAQVEGQMQCSVVQDLGWALYDGYQYDERGNM